MYSIKTDVLRHNYAKLHRGAKLFLLGAST